MNGNRIEGKEVMSSRGREGATRSQHRVALLCHCYHSTISLYPENLPFSQIFSTQVILLTSPPGGLYGFWPMIQRLDLTMRSRLMPVTDVQKTCTSFLYKKLASQVADAQVDIESHTHSMLIIHLYEI